MTLFCFENFFKDVLYAILKVKHPVKYLLISLLRQVVLKGFYFIDQAKQSAD